MFGYISKMILGGAGPRVALGVKLLRFASQKKLILFGRIVEARLQIRYGVYISHKSSISQGLSIRHPVGVVIGEGVTIGSNVTIYQNVTIGGARKEDMEKNNYPSIGDNCMIFAGAAILGDIRVGNNCVIGANSVVISDVPDGCTAVGAPARIIRKHNV